MTQRKVAGMLPLAAVLIVTPSLHAQSGSDQNRLIKAPGTLEYSTGIDKVSMSNGNLSLSIPLLHLPGRGLDTDIVMVYNSKIWRTSWGTDYWTGFYIVDLDDSSLTPSPGWNIGHPRMGRFGSWWTNCLSYNELGDCNLAYEHGTWVTNDGARTSLVTESSYDPTWQPTPRFWSYDGTYVRFYDPGSLVRYKDGVTVRPPLSLDTILKDTNGNLIKCNVYYDRHCTDTLGRVINFNYDAGFQRLQNIAYKDSSGQTKTITFTYQAYHFGYYWICEQPGLTCPTGYSVPPSYLLLKRITLPNNLSYEFEYALSPDGAATGEISKIYLPSGGYIRYEYGWATDPYMPPTQVRWMGQKRVVTQRIESVDGTAASEKVWSARPAGAPSSRASGDSDAPAVRPR